MDFLSLRFLASDDEAITPHLGGDYVRDTANGW
jgi:hypothetical protein